MLQFAKFNAIQTSAYLLLAAVLGCWLYNQLARVTSRPPVPVPRLLKEGITESQTRAAAEKAAAYINKGLGKGLALQCLHELPLMHVEGSVQGGISMCSSSSSTLLAAIANRLASGKETKLTGAVVTALYVVARISGLVSLLGLVYTIVLAAFTLPKVG